jgi:hypothetical protein
MKTELVETICLGCVIRLVAFRHQKHPEWSSMHISTLSNHTHTWHRSLRGRLYFAWKALKGEVPADIDLEGVEDIDKFKAAFDRLYRHIKESNVSTNESE